MVKSVPNSPKKFLPETGDIDYLKLSDLTIIRTGFFPAKGVLKATVLLLNGHREFLEKYSEFIEDFQNRSFNVYSIDHRGQGLSDRALKDRRKSHNPDLNKLVSDINEYCTVKIKPDQLNHPFYIVAHSLGSHLALRYLAEYPNVVGKALLLSPFTDLTNRASIFVWFSKIYFWLMNAIGFAEAFAAGQAKGRNMINHKQAFSKLTHDEKRYQWSQDALIENPDLFIGGVTYGGAAGTVKSLKKLVQEDYLHNIKTPILCLLSEEEYVVNNKSTISLLENIDSATVEFIAGARHEIYREKDEIRNLLWQQIDGFLKT